MFRACNPEDVYLAGKQLLHRYRTVQVSERTHVVKEATLFANRSLTSVPLHRYDVRDICLVIHTFGAISVHSPHFFNDLSKGLQQVSRELTQPPLIAHALWGLATAKKNGVRFSECIPTLKMLRTILDDEYIMDMLTWKVVDFSNIMWGLAAVKLASQGLFDRLAKRIMQSDTRKALMAEPQAASNILWSFASTQLSLSAQTRDHLGHCVVKAHSVEHVVGTLLALSKLGGKGGTHIVSELAKQAEVGTAIEAAMLLSSLSSMRHQAPMIESAAKSVAEADLRNADGRAVGMLLRSCARQHDTVSPLHTALLSLCSDPTRLASFSVESLIEILSGLSSHAKSTPTAPPPAKQTTQEQPPHSLVKRLLAEPKEATTLHSFLTKVPEKGGQRVEKTMPAEVVGRADADVIVAARAVCKRLCSSRVLAGQYVGVVHSLAVLRCVPPDLFQVFRAVFTRESAARELSPKQAASLLWSFVQIRDTDTRIILNIVDSVPDDALPACLWALAKLKVIRPASWGDKHLRGMLTESNQLKEYNVIDVCHIVYYLGVAGRSLVARDLMTAVQERLKEEHFARTLEPKGKRILLTTASRMRVFLHL